MGVAEVEKKCQIEDEAIEHGHIAAVENGRQQYQQYAHCEKAARDDALPSMFIFVGGWPMRVVSVAQSDWYGRDKSCNTVNQLSFSLNMFEPARLFFSRRAR